MDMKPGVANPGVVFQMMNAAQVTAVMSAAIELNVFSALAGAPLDAEAAARKINCPARTTRILLNAMTVIGLTSKDGEKYRLTPLAETYLVPGKQMYMGDMSGILASPTMWQGLSRLSEAVRNDGSVLPEHAETPAAPFWTTFAQASGSMAMGGSMALDELVGQWISKRPKVRVLDVAAGSGIYGYTLVKNHPNVELTTLDWPNVIAESKQWAEKLQIDRKRVSYIEGNLFEVDFKGPYDLILMSHIYHHFDPKTCLDLTRKVSKTLAPGGKVAIQEFLFDGQNPAGTMFSITMLAWTRKGEAYSAKDYRSWLMESGLGNVSVHSSEGMPTSFVLAERLEK